jgi:hypothetical protein
VAANRFYIKHIAIMRKLNRVKVTGWTNRRCRADQPEISMTETFMHTSVLAKSLLMAFATAVGLWFGLFATPAHSQAVDSVEIERRGDMTHVKIQFKTYIQYMRHAPVGSGNSVRIYVQFAGGTSSMDPSDFQPRTQRFPRQGDTPEITVSFPESDNALLVAFDQATKFEVRPNSDGRSIIVVLHPAEKK